MDVTAVVMANQRPRMLRATLTSLQYFPSLVAVCGDEESAAIAKAVGAKVVPAKVSRATGGFSGLRNLALRNVEGSHAFFMDDDETMPPRMATVIKDAAEDRVWGSIRRYNMRSPGQYWPAEYPDLQIRLVDVKKVRWEGLLHESPLGVIKDAGLLPHGGEVPGVHLFHWGWACKYALPPRQASYDRVGGDAWGSDDPEDAWRQMAKKPFAPIPGEDYVDMPIPEPVLEQWRLDHG